MPMLIQRFTSVDRYYQTVKDYLLQQEATNCLMLGLCSQKKFQAQPYLAIVTESKNIVGAAMKTSRQKLILSASISTKAIALIAQDFVSSKQSLPGVIAPKAEALTFAQQWQSITGQSFKLDLAQRIYQLTEVKPITQGKGYLRLATPSDRPLLVDWIQAFSQEALGENKPKQNYQDLCDRRLHQKSLYLWQTNLPVSMAGFSGATVNGIRVNAVYTPPEYRQQGYASSCVAALSQKLLAKPGYKYCFLFTDLANPTSNSIYQTIGYQPIDDIDNYYFHN